MGSVPVKSVKKALDLLTLVAFEDPAGEGIPLNELASAMEFPPSSARNLLKTMISCGYVAQNSEGR